MKHIFTNIFPKRLGKIYIINLDNQLTNITKNLDFKLFCKDLVRENVNEILLSDYDER